MNVSAVEKVAKALLYEGYLLYPYRPSAVKNQQRFNFGVLYPRAYSDLQDNQERWAAQTECLVRGSEGSEVQVTVPFLHLVERSVQKRNTLSCDPLSSMESVAYCEIGGQVFTSGSEAMEREVALPCRTLDTLCAEPLESHISIPHGSTNEEFSDQLAGVSGKIVRTWRPLDISVEVKAEKKGTGVFTLRVRIRNSVSCAPGTLLREEALQISPVSTHAVLQVQGGEFVSLLDPPDELRELATGCENTGMFPVLVGDRARRDTILSSPIILYDYPEVAGESAGDLFDATEIDEILSLRIMTLTEEEKREIRGSDERARRILERTDSLPEEQFKKLHGALRGLRPGQGKDQS